MTTRETYYIERDNIYLWSGTEFTMLPTDRVIEVRIMLVADENKTLFKDGEEIGQAIWLQDDTIDNYVEADIPVQEDEQEEELEDNNEEEPNI